MTISNNQANDSTDYTDSTNKKPYALKWAERFLDRIRQTGNLRLACEVVGIDRGTFYKAYHRLASFKANYDAAMEDATDMLEAEAWKRATVGRAHPIYYNGEVVGTEYVPSDVLLIFLLKHNKPEKYADRIHVTREFTRAAEDTRRVLEEAGISEEEIMQEVDSILANTRKK